MAHNLACRLFIVIALASAVALPVPQPGAQETFDSVWLEKLNKQLMDEQDCEVAFYVRLNEGELGGRKTMEARAQCEDGRAFDASRVEPEATFTIRACDVQTC